MPDALRDLETHRSRVQQELAGVQDMRSGCISGTGGRCGNSRCHCHRPKDPGHGPYFRLTRKVAGKTVTETFSSPAALVKARREVEEYHRFRKLNQELLDVNEQICSLRPVAEPEQTSQEKKRPKRSSKSSRGSSANS